jgi:antitoxin VapB
MIPSLIYCLRDHSIRALRGQRFWFPMAPRPAVGHGCSYIQVLTLSNGLTQSVGTYGTLSPVARTRVFKSGNSHAVRLPAEIAYADMSIELEVTRLGDVITIHPARRSLKETVAILRSMPKPPRPTKRTPIEVPLRKRD